MFTRIVDFVSRRGKRRPILPVQPGFVDEIVLESEVEPNRVLTLRLWKTREQAERYSQET